MGEALRRESKCMRECNMREKVAIYLMNEAKLISSKFYILNELIYRNKLES